MSCRKRQLIIAAATIIALSLAFFHQMLEPGAILYSTDDNIGQNAMFRSFLPRAFLGLWDDTAITGMANYMSISLSSLLRMLLDPGLYTNWIHAVYLSLASFFLLLYLRNKAVGWPSCFIGVLTAFWLASNFTLVYAGHTAKFGVLAFSTIYLWLVHKAAKDGDPAWAILAGSALGCAFLEQPDIAFFLAVFLGPYALFEVWRMPGENLKRKWRFPALLFTIALLTAFAPLWSGYNAFVKGVASVDSEDFDEKWNYCTQWSWPPKESVDFIAPGYYGWRSGEETGPYWGKMGRSPEWEATKQGFQNFKLENQYIGALPLILAALAVFAALASKGALLAGFPEERRAHIFFWGIAALTALLLSFGKFFPLYSLFFKLPVVSSIRNPNKFLQVFQLALAILAAYGFDMAAGPAEVSDNGAGPDGGSERKKAADRVQ
jgi:hypothetical protein